VLERLEDDAQLTGRVWAEAAAARCRGLLERDFEPEFDKAFGRHDRLTMPFERARTALALGERRRRAGRRKEAREPLEEALGAFRHLGAAPWGDRAERELRAAGGRPSTSPGETALAELTPHEVRVALIVAGGATNRDAAAELYVSPKTVDFHLQRIYRKLGVSSRTELGHLVRRVEAPTAP
jgi:DNA-binding CsgD family transcriptional regulator